jgi:hypothetical protein
LGRALKERIGQLFAILGAVGGVFALLALPISTVVIRSAFKASGALHTDTELDQRPIKTTLLHAAKLTILVTVTALIDALKDRITR